MRFFLSLLFCCLVSGCLWKANAQISHYTHAPVIVGQQDLHVAKGQSVVVTPDSLIIGDVDASDYSHYPVVLEEGKNYRVQNNTIIPDPSFTGILYVPCRVKDPKLSSNTYPLEVIVYPSAQQRSLATVRFYVSEKGSDIAKGDVRQPFKTIERALAQVKKLKAASGIPVGGVEIILREGSYAWQKTLVLDEKVSGEKGRPVVIKAYPGEAVLFQGGHQLPYESFQPLTDASVKNRILDKQAAANIRVADLKKMGITNYGSIQRRGYGISRERLAPEGVFSINGHLQTLSRYPNESYSNMIDSVWDDKRKFSTRDKHIRQWQTFEDVWIDGSLTKPWEWSMNEVASFDATNNTITLKHAEYGEITRANHPIYHFKNILEEIDRPGEYYLDRNQDKLYYLPSADFEPGARLNITGLEQDMIQFSDKAHDIWLQGIQLENGRTNGIILAGERNKLLQCGIRSFTRAGVVVSGKYNELVDCHIEYTGMEGVILNDRGGNDQQLIPTCNVLKRCEVNNFSNWFRAYTPGIKASNVGTGISHCKVHSAPHFAIGYNGNDHVLEYTEVFQSPSEFSDMLSVYFNTGNNPQHRGTVIRRNYFHDVNTKWKQGAGVYLDNETYGVAVVENYFYNSGGEESGWSVMVHGGGDNIVRNNIFIDCRFPYMVSTRLNGYAAKQFESRLVNWSKLFQEQYPLLDTAKVAHLKRYPELILFFDDGDKAPDVFDYTFNIKKNDKGEVLNYRNRRTPPTNVFENNLVFNARTDFIKMKAAIEGVTENRVFYTVNSFPVRNGKMQDILIHQNNYYHTINPGFVNYGAKDFRLKKNSPALQQIPALQNIPFEKIGLK